MRYALVTLAVPLYSSTFTYSFDEALFPSPLYKRVTVDFNHRKMTGFVIEVSDEKPEGDYEIKSILKVIDKENVINEELIRLSRDMSYLYKNSMGQCLSLMVPNAKRDTDAAPFFEEGDFSPIEALSPDQERVLREYHGKREEGKTLFYLYGVTGSGKSEVYLRIAEEVIREGGQVLYMVPEITLSEQLSKSVKNRFKSRVQILHSSLTPAQRLKSARLVKNGDVDIVIGARSAIFAPFKNLKLIIMDEEHESSYKASNAPRYHARQLAQLRSRYNDAPLIMGSATPSFECYKLMKEGRIETLILPRRIGKGAFPHIRVVNTLGQRGNISSILHDEIKSELEKKNGVILFLNRRGYSTAVTCNSCGEVVRCPNCSISLTYHKRSRSLKCHSCGFSQSMIETCPTCHSHDLLSTGFGTEKIEEELRCLYPFACIKRLDGDIAQNDREYVSTILGEFERGEIDILLGTQMIAKGLNFPKATLVGVVNADMGLFLPDFRANERTFELLQQVSGRVGRYRDDGRVVIQTSQVDNPAIRAVELNDPEEFYRSEMEIRRKLGYPPYSRMINIRIRSRREERARAEAEAIEEFLSSYFESEDGIEMYPATSALIEMINNYYRYHVLIIAKDDAFPYALKVLEVFRSSYRTDSLCQVEIDTDPIDMF